MNTMKENTMTMANLKGSCLYCGEFAVGPIMTVPVTNSNYQFHPECFCCSRCLFVIGHDDEYILVGLSNLICGRCWKKEPLPLEKQHVIKVVKIPPLSRDGTKYKLRKDWKESLKYDSCTPQISEIGRFGSDCPLNVGDRILEVNGKHVGNQPLPDVEKILNQRTSVVQVTVEHDPLLSVSSPARKLDESKSFGSLSSLELNSSEFWGSYNEMDKSRLSRHREANRSSRPSRRSLGSEERAASLSRLSDKSSSPTPPGFTKAGLCRTLSFREQARSQCTFRACDLVKGELLGKGFFGQAINLAINLLNKQSVYKVTHCETKEVMVLKELYRLDEEAQRNFLKEVAVLRRLEHPNVLRFIGILYKERKLHLITEYVRGGSLREVIQNLQQNLSWPIRSRFSHDIACGVSYLHSMGVIHRDLSSHNCLVREDMSVVVADFGLARITSEMSLADRSRISKRGRRIERKKRYTVVGNPFWMAPEMMKGNKYDEKVDIFSFGIIVCELIGRVNADPDFLPRSGDFSLNQKCFIEKFCESCPEVLYRLAFMCCDLNPDKRPSFELIATWLETISSNLSRGLPFSKDLIDEICSFGGNPVGGGHLYGSSSSESSSSDPETPYECCSSLYCQCHCQKKNCAEHNISSQNNFLEHSSSSSTSSSSSCSSIPTFNKSVRLNSICEVVDHSKNLNFNNNNSSNLNNDLNSTTLTQQQQHIEQNILGQKMNGATLSASPSYV